MRLEKLSLSRVEIRGHEVNNRPTKLHKKATHLMAKYGFLEVGK